MTTDRAVVRGLIAPVYGPWLGMSLCLGMVSVALPLYLTEVGLSYFALSAVLTAVGLGSALGGLPAGDGVARLGSRKVLALGVATIAASTAALATSDGFVVLFCLQLIAGCGSTALRISAQTWITRTAAINIRGRLLSAMGGTRRFGMFVGPLIAGVLIDWQGYTVTFLAAGVLAGLGVIPLVAVGPTGPAVQHNRLSLTEAITRHWRLLLLSTAGPILIMTARRGRNLVLPLIGEDLGLSPSAVGLLVSIGTGADLLLFPVAGYLMDAVGRLAAIVPAFSLMGVGLLLLALADSGAAVAVATGIIGVGNGLSAGTMLTLGTDLAPEDSTSQFLAGFASLQDWGSVIGPLVVGWAATVIGLSASAAVLGIIIFVGVALIVITTGETRARAAATP